MGKKKLSLSVKVFIGFAIGIVLGVIFGEQVLILKPIGDLFLKLIKMLVVPLIFCSITAGVCSIGDMQKLKRIGSKTFLYYISTTALAGAMSLTIANLIRPGASMTAESIIVTGRVYEAKEVPSLSSTILGMFPENIFEALSNGTLMQIIIFGLFLGIAIILLGERGERMRTLFEDGSEIMYKITGMVMETSPYGVCALIASSVGAYGLAIFGPLAKFIGTVYAALFAVLLMYSVMLVLIAKVPLGQFFKKIPEIWLVTASTTSSSGTLPVTINVTRNKFGVFEDLCGFTLPLGATMNMNGGACFYAASVLFVSQIYGVEMTLTQQIMTILIATLVSVGAPGIPGGAIVMSTMLLTTMNLPLDVVGMIAGIFRVIDMGTTTMNVTGDVVSTLCIARGEKMLNEEVLLDSGARSDVDWSTYNAQA